MARESRSRAACHVSEGAQNSKRLNGDRNCMPDASFQMNVIDDAGGQVVQKTSGPATRGYTTEYFRLFAVNSHRPDQSPCFYQLYRSEHAIVQESHRDLHQHTLV